MKTSNRDLLVLTKSVLTDKKEMENEVEKLHNLLFYVESIDNFCIANEIVDIDAYKIIDKQATIKKIVAKGLKPFQFMNNKN